TAATRTLFPYTTLFRSNGGGEKHEPEERHPDALEDAQRAGLEALVELCVERVRDERRARDEAREIDETAVGSHAKRSLPSRSKPRVRRRRRPRAGPRAARAPR